MKILKFREINYTKDIPKIVALINKNLDSNFTKAFFRWKHLENPFGKSYGLVAIDQGEIIGLRMFMFWEFFNIKENKTIRAIRPVDTVVDNSYRGKGLFKQLTLMGLEECKGSYDLIFNTPNENSLPGYLKMGWEQISTKYFKVAIVIPAFSSGNLEFGILPDKISSQDTAWETLKNKSYLGWRFQNDYYKIARFKDAYIIYFISKGYGQNQIVIQEVFGNKRELKGLLCYLARNENAFLFYYYANETLDEIFIFKFNRKKSVVVVKDDFFKIGSEIIFSLGDLEGKL